jgi:hypothetical protein
MRKFLWLLLLGSAWAQNFVSVTASNIAQGATKLPAGQIVFQAVGTNQQSLSYQAGGGGQQILAPTACPVLNGAIVNTCLVANVLFTQPQNICFQVTVFNSSGQKVLGGSNSGYQCVYPQTNSSWCTAGVCNFDTYVPISPSAVLLINLPLPSTLLPGGVYASSCSTGSVVLGINTLGQLVCGLGGSVIKLGTCTMSGASSCTFTLAAAFNVAPICQAQVQGATALAGACSVSGTTVTVYAASANSLTWGAVLYGNPN